MKKLGISGAALSVVLVLAATAAAVTVNGTLDAGDATQTGRLSRNGVASTCAAQKANPGLAVLTGARHYDSYTLTNGTGSPECVTVGLAQTSGTNQGLFTAAYLGSFNPANPALNYLADPGTSFDVNSTSTYSFFLAAGQTAVIVVHEVNPDGCLGCNYTLTYNTVTAVTFASASATRMVKGVLVRWRTGTEADLLGFHVYRSRGHSWQRLSRSLIAAKGSVSGASHRFLDRTARRGVSYRYRIKAVNRDGTTAWFGPVRVT